MTTYRQGQPNHPDPFSHGHGSDAHDSQVPPKLPHGQETRVGGPSVQRRTWRHSPPCPQSQGFRTDEEAHRYWPLHETERTRNRTKSKIQTKVEHAFLVLKPIYGWDEVRYRKLANQYVVRSAALGRGSMGKGLGSLTTTNHRKDVFGVLNARL